MIYRRSAQEIQLATGSRLGTFTLEICLPIHQDVPDYWSLQAMAETERKTICQCFTIPFTYNIWIPTAQWNLAAAWTQQHKQPDIETCKKALNRRVESSEDLAIPLARHFWVDDFPFPRFQTHTSKPVSYEEWRLPGRHIRLSGFFFATQATHLKICRLSARPMSW